jgi:hypothetical protein
MDNISPTTGVIFQGPEDENSRKIPLLNDVFRAFPDIHINLDVKLGSKELIHEASQLITAYQREDRTVWGSFKEEISLNCHKEASFLWFSKALRDFFFQWVVI